MTGARYAGPCWCVQCSVSLITHLVAVSQSGCTPSLVTAHYHSWHLSSGGGGKWSEVSWERWWPPPPLAVTPWLAVRAQRRSSSPTPRTPWWPAARRRLTVCPSWSTWSPGLPVAAPRPPAQVGGHKNAERCPRYFNCPGHIASSLFDKE